MAREEARTQNISDDPIEHLQADPLLLQLTQCQQRFNLLPLAPQISEILSKPTTIVVGVSGGADSVCLLHALKQLSTQWQLDLHIAHLDHNLRPISQQDAQFVAQLAQQWQLPLHTHTLPPKALQNHPGGLEEGARQARYTFLHDIATQVTPSAQTPIIAVAHHADDQAETLLMNLLRGSGLRGLSGMKIVSPVPLAATQEARQSQLIRPLLYTPKAKIRAYLQRHNLDWCEDESNQDPAFLRNRLRHQIMPQLAQINPNLTATLGQTAQLLADDLTRLQRQDQQNFQDLLLDPVQEASSRQRQRIVLNLEKLMAWDSSTRRGILPFNNRQRATGPHSLVDSIVWSIAGPTANHPMRLSLHQRSIQPFQPEHPYLLTSFTPYPIQPNEIKNRVKNRITADPTCVYQTPNGWALWIQSIIPAQLPPDWQNRDQPWRAFLAVHPGEKLYLRLPRSGDILTPLGMKGRSKKLTHLFIDHKVPATLRAGWPLIVNSQLDTILWVCGIRTSYHARITSESQNIYTLYWQIE